MTSSILLRSGYRCPGDEQHIQSAARTLLSTWRLGYELRSFPTVLGATTVLVAGARSERPPVVMMLGGALAAATIESCIAAIARTREVFVVDIPGEPGLSSPGRPVGGGIGPYGLWLDALLPQLTAQTVDVMGHGLGASIAVESVCDRVEHLFLVSPESILPPFRVGIAGIRRRRWLATADVGDIARYLKSTTGPEYVPEPSVSTWFAKVAVYCVPTPRSLRPSTDRWDEACSSQSVTMVVGTEDRVVPQRAVDKFVGRRSHIHKIPMIGVGRFPMLEVPEQFADALNSAPRTHTLE